MFPPYVGISRLEVNFLILQNSVSPIRGDESEQFLLLVGCMEVFPPDVGMSRNFHIGQRLLLSVSPGRGDESLTIHQFQRF